MNAHVPAGIMSALATCTVYSRHGSLQQQCRPLVPPLCTSNRSSHRTQIPPASRYSSLELCQLLVFRANCAGSVSASGNDVVDKIQRYGVKTLIDLRNDYKSRADDVRSQLQHSVKFQ